MTLGENMFHINNRYKAMFLLIFCVFTFASPAHSKITIVQSSERPDIERLINESLIKIFKTKMGKKISRDILGCNVDAIQSHLGVDEATAIKISKFCLARGSKDKLQQKQTYVRPSPLKAINKTIDKSRNGASLKRTYSLLLTDEKEWLIDSWTNSSLNRTSIVLPVSSGNEEIEESRFVEILAHETAVYFDSKFWTGSTGFKSTPWIDEFYNQFNVSSQRINLALDNPLIAHSLAFLRAFKIEQMITAELERRGEIHFVGKDVERRRNKINSFLDCKAQCLHNFIKEQTSKNQAMLLPLMSHASSYRRSLWLDVEIYSGSELFRKNLPDDSLFTEIILDIPLKFYLDNQGYNLHYILESSINVKEAGNSEVTIAVLENTELLVEFMFNAAIPVHLEDLANQKSSRV